MRSNFHNTPELMSMIRPLRAIFMSKNINYVLTWKLRQNTDTFLTDLLPTCYEMRHFIFSSWNLSETEKSKDERVRRPSDVFCDHSGGRETAGSQQAGAQYCQYFSASVTTITAIQATLGWNWIYFLSYFLLHSNFHNGNENSWKESRIIFCQCLYRQNLLEWQIRYKSRDIFRYNCIGCFLHRRITWSCLSTKFLIYNSSKSFSNRFSLCDSYIIYSLLDKKSTFCLMSICQNNK